jgi:hypothetical protein
LGVAVLIAAAAAWKGNFYVAILLGMLAWSNIQALMPAPGEQQEK